MRVIRDMGYVKQRKRAATLTSVAGVVLLGFAFWLSLSGGPNSNNVLLAYVPLLAGTFIFHWGMQQVAQWNRSPRNDQALDTLLKGLGEKYALIHFVPAGKRVVQHVLVHPGGVEALTVRELPGKITYKDGRWGRARQGLGRMFGMGGPQLGNPSHDAAQDVASLKELLAEHQMEANVDAAIAFINHAVDLDVEEPDFPVVNADGLPLFVRELPVDPTLKQPERQALIEIMAQGEHAVEEEKRPTRRPVKRRAA